ncbi:unnamed protein product [Aspergillus oryzae]|uniref:Unnamed protein product n=2 Tax=Aspergillus oryzae TaxID=5062 RepID=A0AAN4YIL0_ASPOZ|nr:unnamed protein product [Aspergillus oryzae]GMG27547.1 unnamed protein product [Aspergillus oryzae]GMG54189.1 unnamed protein product [Aspergillus oryzae var. brunneus]
MNRDEAIRDAYGSGRSQKTRDPSAGRLAQATPVVVASDINSGQADSIHRTTALGGNDREDGINIPPARIEDINAREGPQSGQEQPHPRLQQVGESVSLSYVVEVVYSPKDGSTEPLKVHYPIPASIADRPGANYAPRFEEPVSLPEALTMPPRDLADQLIQTFFERLHPAYPVFDRQKFTRLYRQGQASPLVLQTIFFLGFTVDLDTRPDRLSCRLRFGDDKISYNTLVVTYLLVATPPCIPNSSQNRSVGDILIGEFSPRRDALDKYDTEGLATRLADWESQLPDQLRKTTPDGSLGASFWASMLQFSYQLTVQGSASIINVSSSIANNRSNAGQSSWSNSSGLQRAHSPKQIVLDSYRNEPMTRAGHISGPQLRDLHPAGGFTQAADHFVYNSFWASYLDNTFDVDLLLQNGLGPTLTGPFDGLDAAEGATPLHY